MRELGRLTNIAGATYPNSASLCPPGFDGPQSTTDTMSPPPNGATTEETDENVIKYVTLILSQHGYRVRVNENGFFVAIKSDPAESQNEVNWFSDSRSPQVVTTRVGGNETTNGHTGSARLAINQANRTCKLDGHNIELTTAEFELLWFLAERVGIVVSRSQLFQHLLGLNYDGRDRTIDLRITRLRRKLGDDPRQPQLIKSIRGVGYILVAD